MTSVDIAARVVIEVGDAVVVQRIRCLFRTNANVQLPKSRESTQGTRAIVH
jgi:hypothetical protein